MKEVANILGVELGEEFKIKGCDRTYRFTIYGLFDCHSNEAKYTLYFLLTGKYEIEKHILDKVEKCYLENLLRPFKDKVEFILKSKYKNKEYLYIQLNMNEWIGLPYFKKNTMYKGMELEKQYTLEEMGLFEND